MADYSANLPDPGQIGGPRYGSSGDSIGDIIGGSLTGLAKIADVGLKHFETERDQKVQTDVGNKLTDLTQQYAGQNTTPLVGQPSADPSTVAADASPVVQDARKDLNNLSQAQSQGKMSKMEYFTRASSIVQDAVNQNPIFGQEIRNSAKEILGVAPTVEQIALASADEENAKTLSNQVQHDNVMAATNAGVVFRKDDGSLDLSKMADSGSQVQFQETLVKKQLEDANLAAAKKGTPVSHDDVVDQESRAVLSATNPVFEHVSDGLLKGVPELVQKLANQGQDKQVAGVLQAIGTGEATFNGWLDKQVVAQNLSPDTVTKIHAYYKGIFDNYRQLASGGKLDQFSTNAAALDQMKTRTGIQLQDSAPTIAKLHVAGGDTAVAAVLSTMVGTGTKLRTDLQNDASSFLTNTPHPLTVGNATAAALTGKQNYDLSKEQSPALQQQVLRGVTATLNGYTSRPDALNPTEQKAFGHSIVQVTGLGLQSNDPNNLGAAAKLVTSPSAIRTFQNFAKSATNADQVPLVAQGAIALATKHVLRTLPVIQQGQTVNVFPDSQAADNGKLLGGSYIPNAPMALDHANASAYFNPLTGRVEMTVSGTNDAGKKIQLSPTEINAAMPQFKSLQGQIVQVNQSLDALTVYKDHGVGREKELKPMELKQLLVAGANFPNRPGTQGVPLPDWLTHGNGTPNAEQPQSGFHEKHAEAVIGNLVPGAKITSEFRSAEDNARVGGAKGSMHQSGQAMDFVAHKPDGSQWDASDLSAFKSKLDSMGIPHTELMIEQAGQDHSTGYHIHWGWGSKTSGRG